MEKSSELSIQISKVSDSISAALKADRTSIYIVNKDKYILECIYASGIENEQILTIPLGRGICGRVAQSKILYLTNNAYEDSSFDPYYDSITSYTTKTIICVPIINEVGDCIGVIQALNKEDGFFSKNDLLIINGFSSTASILIENSKLYEITKQMRESVNTLLNVSSIINSELELDKVVELIITKSSEITNSDRSTFFLYDEKRNMLMTHFGQGLNNLKIETDKGIVGLVAHTKKSLIENDPHNNPYFDSKIDQKTNYTTKSILGVPVLNTNNELIGVIEVINKNTGRFTNQDLQIMEGFASHIAIAIQNAKLFGEVYSMKNYFNLLFENLDNGIITFDKEGYVKTVNSQFCNIFGVSKSNCLDKHFSGLEQNYPPLYKYTKDLFESGKRQKATGLEVLDENDRKTIYNLSSLPMTDIEGHNIGAINVIQDITKEIRVQQNLSRYLPNHLVNEILSKDDLSLLDGKYRRCSVMFSDLRNFTSITENMGAVEVVKFLNYYFSEMVNSVVKNKGILDKFIGDAIMAVFGIPYPNKEDAVSCVKSALDMLKKVSELSYHNSKVKSIKIGIGIATGNVISGNVGSNERFEYTVIGDSVNLASRLEGLSKEYGLDILVCSTTYNKIRDHFHCREIDTLCVKGKQTPTKVYTIIAEKTEKLQSTEIEFSNYYATGLNYLKQKNYRYANIQFLQAQGLKPTDVATSLHLKRIFSNIR